MIPSRAIAQEADEFVGHAGQRGGGDGSPPSQPIATDHDLSAKAGPYLREHDGVEYVGLAVTQGRRFHSACSNASRISVRPIDEGPRPFVRHGRHGQGQLMRRPPKRPRILPAAICRMVVRDYLNGRARSGADSSRRQHNHGDRRLLHRQCDLRERLEVGALASCCTKGSAFSLSSCCLPTE